MKLIRWVGHPSPFEAPAILKALVAGRIPRHAVDRMRRMEQARISAMPGKSIFEVGIAHGFSRDYRFGPHQFEVWMEDADWALLQSSRRDRWMFLDVTDRPLGLVGTPAVTRPPLSGREWEEVFAAFEEATLPLLAVARG